MPTMRYRLALDLGSNSLGWALIRLNAEQQTSAIIKAGVRIFSDGRNPKDGTSMAVSRRNARAMRRNRVRKCKRKHHLFAALIRLGFLPLEQQEQAALFTLDPYSLRAAGLDRALTGPEFARVLVHLNQRRGFLSNRKTDRKDNDASTLKKAISSLRHELSDGNYRTLGEWLAIRHTQHESVRARMHGMKASEKAYDFYAERAMIAHEFDTLWATQAQYAPALFNDAARAELKNILLFQRNLRPQKPGRCSLLPDEPRAPLALPTTQRFRIYQELNNLRILSATFEETPLSLAQRDTLAALLEQGTLSFTGIRKALKLSGTVKFNLEDAKRDRLKGNASSMVLAKPELFGTAWHLFSVELQDEIVLHLLDESDEAVLLAWLQSHTKVTEEQAGCIANTSLPDGYGSLSQRALQMILPAMMKDVMSYDKAVISAGFASHNARAFSLPSGEVMAELPYYGITLQRHVGFAKDHPSNEEELHGKIGNITVHIGLNQIRLVVNELIREYGHPNEVVIQVARELKLTRERKQEIEREQAQNQKRNEELVRQACVVLGLDESCLSRTKRRVIAQKMQLWRELNIADTSMRCCPYSGEVISLVRLLSDDIEIDHILPYSRSLDDSMGNKTIATRHANRLKANLTPYEAFGQQTLAGFDYNAVLQRASHLPVNKRRLFGPDGYVHWLAGEKNFLRRSLIDRAYLSRLATDYLCCICPRVNAIPNRLTNTLRGKFSLNQLLANAGEKNREDLRHHAIDAMVIGVTDQRTLQNLAMANRRAKDLGLDRSFDLIPLPWPTFREHVARAIASIYISYKPEHGYQGAMHEETAWGLLPDGRAHRRERTEANQARERIIKNLSLIKIRDENQARRHGLDADGLPKAYKGYVGGSNYCLEIFCDEKGRWQSAIISTFDAYQIIRQLGEQAGWQRLRHPKLTQSGKPLVMRLCKKDYLRLEIDGQTRTIVVAKMSSNGQIFMAEHFEADVDARNRDVQNSFAYFSKTAGSLQKAKARRCTVSPIGKLRDPGFKDTNLDACR